MRRVLASLIAVAPLWAQAAAPARVSLLGPRPEVIRVGDTATFTLRVDGADAASLGALPAVAGLLLAAAPPVIAQGMAAVAGRMVAQPSVAFVIRATAQRPGSFELPALSAVAHGQTLTTRTARLEALPELAGSDRAFIELLLPRRTCYLHERVELRLRFGFERAFARDSLVPMFMREFDVAALVRASWWDDLPQAIVPAAQPEAPGPRASLALNGGTASALRVGEVVRDGHTFAVFELARTLLPEQTGELVVPGPSLRFAFATRFDDDFVHGRVAADRIEGCVQGESLALRVEPWPAADQPGEFGGAVGRFSVQALAEPAVVAVGDSCKLRVRITGDGNLAQFAPPRLDRLDGFHLRGMVEANSASERTIIYDLTPLQPGAKLPAIAFACLDPTPPGAYRMVSSAPIDLRVVPATTVAPDTRERAPAHKVAGVDDIFDLMSSARARTGGERPSGLAFAAALLAPWLLALGLAAWLRARDQARRDPLRARARAAAAAFRAQRATGGTDVHGALIDYLAARLHCQTAAIIAANLGDRLVAAGVTPALAARTTQVIELGAAARYGGAAASLSPTDAGDLVDALEQCFQRAGAKS